MKNQKGITLIALVITIIVLLILAGVSIAMLTGDNGILTQATTAKENTSKAEDAERINMELNSLYASVLADKTKTAFTNDESSKVETNLGGSDKFTVSLTASSSDESAATDTIEITSKANSGVTGKIVITGAGKATLTTATTETE